MRWLVILVSFLFVTTAFADSHEPAEPSVDDFLAERESGSLKPPKSANAAVMFGEVEERFNASLVEYYRYHETGYQHRRAVFEWQLLSSKIIFVVVIGIVALGGYFSWLQFMAGRREDDGDREKTDAKDTSTVELSFKGIKVTSPVLGVVILTISLGFFYLYLVHVYPVLELF